MSHFAPTSHRHTPGAKIKLDRQSSGLGPNPGSAGDKHQPSPNDEESYLRFDKPVLAFINQEEYFATNEHRMKMKMMGVTSIGVIVLGVSACGKWLRISASPSPEARTQISRLARKCFRDDSNGVLVQAIRERVAVQTVASSS